MDLDARTFRDGQRLEADLCIIGAGPAGITVAQEWIDSNRQVLLLESGGSHHDAQLDDLNGGSTVGDAYADLRSTRNRGCGGTAQIWNTPVLGELGAKYVPLDNIDFAERPGVAFSGWPFDRSHLEPFYRRAQQRAGLGRFAYDAHEWTTGPGLALAGQHVTTRVYQFAAASHFTQRNLGQLRNADNIRVCQHATVCALELDSRGARVVSVRLRNPVGAQVRCYARVFVLAAGAIENARLLLASGGSHTPGNAHGWVGRGFMEHPRDYALTWVPRAPELFQQTAFYDAHAEDGCIIGGRLALTDEAIQSRDLPNASATLLPRLRTQSTSQGVSTGVLDYLRSLGKRRASEGYGWSRVTNPAALFDRFRLIINLEQHPDRENRVVLGDTRDAYGVPRVVLHWRWRADEQAGLERLRRTIAASIEDAGLGVVQIQSELRPDPNAHHHAGTTRMHPEANQGVVDADARVHGTENLYVAGASVFPTAGFANPTLTIVAMAIRLSEHIKERGIYELGI
jgi:choline dehydrogenase-like flavoprotein